MTADDVVRAVEQFNGFDDDAEDIFRLYRPEWTIAYTAAASHLPDGYKPEELDGICQEHFQSRYVGRVHMQDVRCTSSGTGVTSMVRLELRLPTLKGEFKYRADAEAHAREKGWETYAIVERGSRADHDLRNYGVKMLDAA